MLLQKLAWATDLSLLSSSGDTVNARGQTDSFWGPSGTTAMRIFDMLTQELSFTAAYFVRGGCDRVISRSGAGLC